MDKLGRRRFGTHALRGLLGYALVDSLIGCARHTDPARFAPAEPPDGAAGGNPSLREDLVDQALVSQGSGHEMDAMAAWLQEIQALGEGVKRGSIAQAQWTASMEGMLGALDLDQLLGYLDFERFVADIELANNGAARKQVVFPDDAGLPSQVSFVRQVFALGQGRAIVPHGHNNMVSSFLVLGGEFRGRHYERLGMDDRRMLLSPSIDRTFGVGDISSLSDDKDNVHWYLARRSPSYLFNIHVRDVVPGSTLPTGRVYVDPRGEELSDGIILARRIDSSEAHALYG